MRDFSDDIGALRRRLGEAERYLDLEGKRKRLVDLEVEVGKPDLWDDADNARAVSRDYQRVRDDIDVLERLGSRVSDVETLHELAVEESDETVAGELETDIAALAAEFDRLELRSLFTGDYDENDAVCEVHAGAGG